jgi:hypothetical protein
MTIEHMVSISSIVVQSGGAIRIELDANKNQSFKEYLVVFLFLIS